MRLGRRATQLSSLSLGHGRLQLSKIFASRRIYSTQAVLQVPGNEVKTKIRNGIGRPIEVVITYPPRPEHDSPVILALGNGTHQHERDNHAQALSWSTNATIVSPLYEITRQWSFPSPVHMTLAVFDWISQNLIRADLGAQRRKLGVCGGGVCGTLATMLALTECNPSQPCISAAAVHNPVLDWTDIFPKERDMVIDDLQRMSSDSLDGLSTPQRPGGSSEWDGSLDSLLGLRKEIFRRAEDYFDPFASPLLLFRTPHFDLPYSFYRNAAVEAQRNGSSNEDNSALISRKRTYYRVYPPLRSRLFLPKIRMTVGKDYVLNHQSAELDRFMRRSLLRDKEQLQSIREEDLDARIMVEEKDGQGTWDQGHVVEMGQWLGEVLRDG